MEKRIEKFKEPINVTRSFLPPKEEYEKEIESIWDSHWLTNKGRLHEQLQEELKKYLKIENGILYTNGHLALDIAIKGLGLKGEVITTPFTFASTTHAIVMNGLEPVFCDIDMKNYNIDVTKIESLITEKTSAIIPVHVYGIPCNVQEIERIAKKYNLKVIYDAAHATGVEIEGQGIGSFGDISMFSFHATKVFNTVEGGLLSFKDKKLNIPLELFKNFGITGKESVEEVGLNAKMSEFHAAMGLVNLRYLNEQIDKRRNIFNLYKEELDKIDGIITLKQEKNIKYNYAYFPILLDEKISIDRNILCSELEKYNVLTRKYFYPLVTEYGCYKGKFKSDNLVNAKYVSDRILTLPIYSDLELENVLNIVKIIKEIITVNRSK